MGIYASHNGTITVPDDRIVPLAAAIASHEVGHSGTDGGYSPTMTFEEQLRYAAGVLTLALGAEDETVAVYGAEDGDGFQVDLRGYGKLSYDHEDLVDLFARNGAEGRIDMNVEGDSMFRYRLGNGKYREINAVITYPDPLDPPLTEEQAERIVDGIQSGSVDAMDLTGIAADARAWIAGSWSYTAQLIREDAADGEE